MKWDEWDGVVWCDVCGMVWCGGWVGKPVCSSAKLSTYSSLVTYTSLSYVYQF